MEAAARLETFLDLLLVARPPGSEQAAEVGEEGSKGVSPKFPKVREAIAGVLEGMGWQVGFLQEFSVIMIVIWKVIIISKVEDQQFTAISPFGEEVRLPFFRNVVKGDVQKKNCHNNSATSL